MHTYTKLILWAILAIITIDQKNLHAQDVKISRDINIKNDFAYDLVHFADQFVFYRDKGFDYYFDLFDVDLNYKRTVDFELNERKAFIECIHTIDSSMCVYYSYRKSDTIYVTGIKFDKSITPIDTVEVYKSKEGFAFGDLRYLLSEDKTQLAFFYLDRKKLKVFSVNSKTFDLGYNYSIELLDFDTNDDFQEAEVSNTGESFFLFEKNNTSWEKDNHQQKLVTVDIQSSYFTLIHCKGVVAAGSKMIYDNKNKILTIAGLYGERANNETEGYYYTQFERNSLKENREVEINKKSYDLNIIKDLMGVDIKQKRNSIVDFYPKSIVLRADGGLVLVSELNREYARRVNNYGVYDNRFSSGRNSVDYYSDDLILFSINPDGSQLWRKILFKKQFSQDDEGVYSSFLVLKAPSSMHIIYNDEIKNHNTVSEYVIDPLGNFRRNSILNTEYKNLKMRFRNGIQIGPSSFVVPSEKSGIINLVRVDL